VGMKIGEAIDGSINLTLYKSPLVSRFGYRAGPRTSSGCSPLLSTVTRSLTRRELAASERTGIVVCAGYDDSIWTRTPGLSSARAGDRERLRSHCEVYGPWIDLIRIVSSESSSTNTRYDIPPEATRTTICP
jgi:hypothetical protein